MPAYHVTVSCSAVHSRTRPAQRMPRHSVALTSFRGVGRLVTTFVYSCMRQWLSRHARLRGYIDVTSDVMFFKTYTRQTSGSRPEMQIFDVLCKRLGISSTCGGQSARPLCGARCEPVCGGRGAGGGGRGASCDTAPRAVCRASVHSSARRSLRRELAGDFHSTRDSRDLSGHAGAAQGHHGEPRTTSSADRTLDVLGVSGAPLSPTLSPDGE
jgi:hypothetical protein